MHVHLASESTKRSNDEKELYVLMLVSLMLFLPLAAQAFPPKKGDKDCIECHKLDKKEAEAIVKKVVPTGTVTDIKQSPIKGVWQIDVDAGEGKRGALYLDFSKKNLVAGQIVPVETLGKQAAAQEGGCLQDPARQRHRRGPQGRREEGDRLHRPGLPLLPGAPQDHQTGDGQAQRYRL